MTTIMNHISCINPASGSYICYMMTLESRIPPKVEGPGEWRSQPDRRQKDVKMRKPGVFVLFISDVTPHAN